MNDEIKVSQLPEATSVNDEDLMMIVQDGINKKTKASNVGTGAGGDTLPVGTVVEYDGDTVPEGYEEVEEEGEVYSTEEQVIGTWIDGKPLYRKTINNIVINSSSQSIDIGFDTTIIPRKIYGFYHDIGNDYLPLNFNIGEYYANIFLRNGQLQYRTGLYNNGTICVTVEYTKTTD